MSNTMCEGREREIADALNCMDPDLRNSEEGLTELVANYFLTPVNDPVENYEDGDVDEEEEEEVNYINDITTPVMGQIRENYVEEQNSAELDKISNFSCKCTYKSERRAKSCISMFMDNDILQMRLTMAELQEDEKDLMLLGKIDSMIDMSANTSCSKRSVQKVRQHQRTTYYHRSHQICRESFKFIHCISQNKLTNLLKFYKEKGGFEPRPKKGKRSHHFKHHLTVEDVRCVVTFLENYAEDHALCLPGRIAGYRRTDIRLLPCYETKVGIHEKYQTAMKTAEKRAVSLSSFKKMWEKYVPFITVAKPMTDLCAFCQKYSLMFQRAACLDDQQKAAQLQEYMDHLSCVKEERALYQEMKRSSREAIGHIQDIKLSRNPPCSKDITMHYSFDYAQQVHYPSNPLQPGPIYFLTPRKCGIFGIHCEAIPQQVNYLIDEAMESSKGSSAVVSHLHHFFNNYGLGEKTLQLHCDNCSGQNKNRYVLWYFCWRVIHSLHKDVSLNFLIAGHTKFAPDWCFGLFKQRFRKTPVSCLQDIADVVTASTPSQINIPQLVGNEDGTRHVPFYNWNEFLTPYFRPLPAIHSMQHFRFTASSPGLVFYKEKLGSTEKSFQLLRPNVGTPPRMLPVSVPPPGLSAERQQYLYMKIREFCREDCRDVTCPKPN